MPGDHCEVESIRKPSHISFMNMQQVCQPEAASPPRMLALPASSSRCIGWASNSLANSMISSAVTCFCPRSIVAPSAKSSNAQRFPVIGKSCSCLNKTNAAAARKRQFPKASFGFGQWLRRLMHHALLEACDAAVSGSGVELEHQHVAVLDDVFLALVARLACFLRRRLAAELHVVVEGDRLGADEAALEGGVDDAGCLQVGRA